MALTNYTTLKTSIANWLNRSDLSSEIADDFIVLTEADFNSKLRVRKMIASADVTINAYLNIGSATTGTAKVLVSYM